MNNHEKIAHVGGGVGAQKSRSIQMTSRGIKSELFGARDSSIVLSGDNCTTIWQIQ